LLDQVQQEGPHLARPHDRDEHSGERYAAPGSITNGYYRGMIDLSIRRAAVYLRVSLDKDSDEKAVDRQRELSLDLASRRGWEVVNIYTDNSISASKREIVRPAYERMLSDYRNGAFNALICYDLDRLTRQPRQLEDWIDEAEKNGLVIMTLNGEADLGTDGGRMFARIKAAVARSEIERKGARQKAANRQRAESGAWQFSRRPYGYRRDGKKIVQVPEEVEALREGYAAYLAGHSYREIAADWNERGLRTTLGYPWRAEHVLKALRNPRLAGYVVYDNKLIPAASSSWEPVIDKRTWADFIAVKSGRKKAGAPSAGKPKHLLSGTLQCNVCGDSLYATKVQRRMRNDGTRAEPFRVYDCMENRCVSIAAPALETMVEQLVLGRLTDRKILRRLRSTPDTTPIEAELQVLNLNLKNIYDLVGGGEMLPIQAKPKVEELNRDIERLQTRLATMRKESPLNDLAASRAIPDAWNKMSIVQKRRVIADLGLKIVVKRGVRGKRGLDVDRLEVEWA